MFHLTRDAIRAAFQNDSRHKGLKRLFEKDDTSGIRPGLLGKVRTILAQLDQAQTIEDMRMTRGVQSPCP